MTQVLIDGPSVVTAVAWMVALVAWSYVLGTILAHVMLNWWRIERATVERWRSIPLVASIRHRRQREDWNYWWATRTPEQMAEYRAAVERTNAMMREMGDIIASVGVSASEAAESMAEFGRVYREAMEGVKA